MPADQRKEQADIMATQHGWKSLLLHTKQFTLLAYVPENLSQAEQLSIYIEGDGLAWLDRTQPSLDPTPINPIGLKLAMQQPSGVAVYLARPCQFVKAEDAQNCAVTYWTDRRFSEEVIVASDQAVTQLVNLYHVKRIELVGYSGGAAVAALIAARRRDVERLITVAGNLDHAAWTQTHHISPLAQSLNAADAWKDLTEVPQFHFVGGKDRNIGQEVTDSYLAHFPSKKNIHLKVIDDFGHACCWAEQWKKLYPYSGNTNQ